MSEGSDAGRTTGDSGALRDRGEAASPLGLRAGALGLPAVLMQAITHIAPAVAIVFSFQFAVSLAGGATPVVYLITFFIVMMLAIALSQLARAFPSAGGYYTYVSRTVHPRAGFIVSWVYMLFAPPSAGLTLAFFGEAVLEPQMEAAFGFALPWWAFVVVSLALVQFIVYRGIEISGTLMIVLGVLEILILVALGVWGLFSPGDGGFNLSPFNPAEAPDVNGLFLAVIYSIFLYTGWEGAAPLAEESENPRRNVPLATVGSVVIHGAFLLLVTWGLLVGWGTSDIQGLVNSEELPPFVLAREFWGELGVWIIVFALLNSSIAVSIATINVSTRMWFAMGRSGSLPRALGRVHPEHRSPVNALWLQLAVSIALGLVAAALIGPQDTYFLWATTLAFSLVVIYIGGNLGVFRYYYREARDRFNPLIHAVFPLVSSIVLLVVGYKSAFPLPDPPIRYAPVIFGVWLVIGIVVLVVMNRTGREAWLLEAGRVAEEQSSEVHKETQPGVPREPKAEA